MLLPWKGAPLAQLGGERKSAAGLENSCLAAAAVAAAPPLRKGPAAIYILLPIPMK